MSTPIVEITGFFTRIDGMLAEVYAKLNSTGKNITNINISTFIV